MAKALHPDKCGAPRAKDAFQRLYQVLVCSKTLWKQWSNPRRGFMSLKHLTECKVRLGR